MVERVMVVCDICGAAPAETVTMRVRDRNLQKDLCAVHVEELTRGARAPRRGRPRRAPMVAAAAPKRRGRPPKIRQS